jgi:ribosomal protein S27E
MTVGTDFKYGDLIVKCHQCGNIQVVEELITDGRAIYIFNKKDSWFRLSCPECNITMEMSMRPSVNVEIEEVKNEELPQESSSEETV